MRLELIEVLRTGTFGPIALGATASRLIDAFGPPTDHSIPSRKHHGASRTQGQLRVASDHGILRYGDLEFHFADGRLWLIHCDSPTSWAGGGGLDLDPGPFIPSTLLAETIDFCTNARLAFETEELDHLDQTLLWFTGPAHLLFAGDDSGSARRVLGAFSLAEQRPPTG